MASNRVLWFELKKLLSLFAAFWHGYLLGIYIPFKRAPWGVKQLGYHPKGTTIFLIILCPNQKNCLFNPEETLALAFDGVRRVGDHNFNRRLKMTKGNYVYTHET